MKVNVYLASPGVCISKDDSKFSALSAFALATIVAVITVFGKPCIIFHYHRHQIKKGKSVFDISISDILLRCLSLFLEIAKDIQESSYLV